MKTLFPLFLSSPLLKDEQGEDTRILMPQGKLQNEQNWHFVRHPFFISFPPSAPFCFFVFTPNALLLLDYYTRLTFYTPQTYFLPLQDSNILASYAPLVEE